MKKVLIASMALVLSCGDFTEANIEYGDSEVSQSAWVCHNPGTPQHGSLCEVAIDPFRGQHESCYWVRDGSHGGLGYKVEQSFCWLLTKEDCSRIEFQWQKDNCHLLNGDMAK